MVSECRFRSNELGLDLEDVSSGGAVSEEREDPGGCGVQPWRQSRCHGSNTGRKTERKGIFLFFRQEERRKVGKRGGRDICWWPPNSKILLYFKKF